MKTFPACLHRSRRPPAPTWLDWLASEPFRIFFIIGAVWSIIGVALWPLFFWGRLGFYPNVCHARLMIQAFGGAFIIGFLGTAAPRMLSAPRLRAWELLWLLALHQACAICHLLLRHSLADAFFALLLLSIGGSIGLRSLAFRPNSLPPRMLLAGSGLVCGALGALGQSASPGDANLQRVYSLFLQQGFLLLPVLGIGSFLFPRMLGGDFGEPKTPACRRAAMIRAVATAAIIVASFVIEATAHAIAGAVIRALAAALYLALEVPWRTPRTPGGAGTMVWGLKATLITGWLGIWLPGIFLVRRVALEHLLYIGGFGLLMIIVASRVLLGHNDELHLFQGRSWTARWLIFLALLTAATRVIPGFLPRLIFTHYQYAALTWTALIIVWLAWHRRRFFSSDKRAVSAAVEDA